MILQDQDEFISLMSEMCWAFSREVEVVRTKIYFKHLQDLSIYQVRMAINRIIAEGERFPAVSEVKKVARTYRAEPLPENRHLPLIELHVPEDAPKTKEAFLKAMAKLTTSMEG